MKKIRQVDMTPGSIQGAKGSVDVYDAIHGEMTAGVRIIKHHSDVPTRPHIHPEKQLIYVIAGSGKITNGEESLDLECGDFILLEANEEHYVITDNEELKVFEIKYPSF